MSNSPTLVTDAAAAGGPDTPNFDTDYWYALIEEGAAAEFLNLARRSMQGYRYRGGGPRWVSISARCVKYRRIDLRRWAEAKLRSSTSER
jgi:hypothetical protein